MIRTTQSIERFYWWRGNDQRVYWWVRRCFSGTQDVSTDLADQTSFRCCPVGPEQLSLGTISDPHLSRRAVACTFCRRQIDLATMPSCMLSQNQLYHEQHRQHACVPTHVTMGCPQASSVRQISTVSRHTFCRSLCTTGFLVAFHECVPRPNDRWNGTCQPHDGAK